MPSIQIKKMNITKEQANYIAGIIDGEGSILLSKIHKQNFRHPVISISSTTYEIMEYLKNNVGGTISTKHEKNPKYKKSWKWTITNRKALELLENITPYLLVPEKKQRAELLLSTYIKITPRNGRYNEQQRKEKLKFEENFMKIK